MRALYTSSVSFSCSFIIIFTPSLTKKEIVMLLNPRVIISRGRVEIIGQFENTGHYLTVDQTTERIGVLKILNDANANVYDFLMHHPHKNLCTIYDTGWKMIIYS